MISARHRLPARVCVAVLTAAVLLLPTSGPAGAGDRTPAASTTAGPTDSPAPRAAEGLRSWKCTKWRGSASSYQRSCARLRVLNEKFNIDYQRSYFNKFRRQTVPFQCSTSKSKTYSFGVSVTGEVEAGVIFAKVKMSATASVSASYTTQDTASAVFKVRPRGWAHCERGTYIYDFAGQVRKTSCNASGCRNSVDDFKGHAPSRDVFIVGPGRG